MRNRLSKVAASTIRSRKRLGADCGVHWHGHKESLAGSGNRLIPGLEFCSIQTGACLMEEDGLKMGVAVELW
jgi:hypothetical protein